MVLGSGVGARTLYILTRVQVWSTPDVWFRFWDGGMVSYGGLAGALTALVFQRRSRGLPLLPFLDSISPCLLIGWAIGRLGCFMTWYGEEGTPSTLPWAVLVGEASYHPATLYLSLGLFVGGFILLRIPPLPDFKVTALALMVYGLIRCVCDSWRVYHPPYLRTLSQLAASGVFVSGLALLLSSRRVRASDVESTPGDE
jgi:phosphatidylglycerol---prolipoprotein diacylglyceryl transferase